jgi:GTP-binding protein
VNRPDLVHFSYERYMMNQLREQLGLNQVPIRIKFKKR